MMKICFVRPLRQAKTPFSALSTRWNPGWKVAKQFLKGFFKKKNNPDFYRNLPRTTAFNRVENGGWN
jgi:hypothetical protein